MKALLLLLLAAGAVRAERPINPPAPEFPPVSAWLNATQLSMSRLRDRKVVVVAFINPTSINSVRVLPALKAWFDGYALSQVMVIGVLTPDLDFHREAVWAKNVLKRYGADYPVVLDSDRRIWKSYANEGWPALYLIDRRGRIVFDRLGEGGYQEFEKELRLALSDLIGASALPPSTGVTDPPRRECGAVTTEISLGARPGAKRAITLDKDISMRRALIVEARDGEAAQHGRWDTEADGLRLAQANKTQSAFLRVVYHAAQALAVMSPPESGRARVFVKQDDLWLHEGNKGRDIQFDDDGRSFVVVDSPRLYDLTRDSIFSPHELFLIPERQGATIHGMSFSDACVVTTLP
ncbi:MAG: redoxin family protein [Elusimicrobia bacterium]|nr:redoxin family protein [Elusimicrobiota bacterium]